MRSIFIVSLILSSWSTWAQKPRFLEEIQAFKLQDSISAPPDSAILFVGSSSFRVWSDVHNDFPYHVIINRGFGGSQLTDVIRYADNIIFPYHAKQIVIYCGENDLASSDSITAKMVFDRFVKLFEMIREKDSVTNITFVSIKPSPSRQKIQSKVIEANKMISEFLQANSMTSFVNVYDLMIDSKGKAKRELFNQDMLHMKPNGYAIWKKAIEPYLLK